MDAERLAMQRRIDTLDEYATRLHAALTEAERENAQLKAELETVKRERDALRYDIEKSGSCAVCGADGVACLSCGGLSNFAWRGLCAENGGAEDA